ncbi:MAG: tRNA (N6-threonylcarbamoyladenosine(37)-N6)-methyltransferase TrmO [Thermovirgaceae bacterium]|nr:tRNA (N6-threonylcarbamoyladenosine(37)-N6)-methyltransferase TrmO [Thermovirgaceae bacterium]
MNGFPIFPVGLVSSSVKSLLPPDHFRDIESEIHIFPWFEPALEGLREEVSIVVLFRFHFSGEYSLRVHPRGDLSRPLKGVFATCSPNRPNHIGLSRVHLIGITGNRLLVRGLDAIDGTPVVDLKPFKNMDLPGNPPGLRMESDRS